MRTFPQEVSQQAGKRSQKDVKSNKNSIEKETTLTSQKMKLQTGLVTQTMRLGQLTGVRPLEDVTDKTQVRFVCNANVVCHTDGCLAEMFVFCVQWLVE